MKAQTLHYTTVDEFTTENGAGRGEQVRERGFKSQWKELHLRDGFRKNPREGTKRSLACSELTANYSRKNWADSVLQVTKEFKWYLQGSHLVIW